MSAWAQAVCPDPAQPVTVPDEGLEAALRQVVGRPEAALRCGELASLKALSAPFSGIRSLEGLEFATGLERLDLDGNEIQDLTNLERLDLGGNPFSDLSPLAGLSNLRVLDLGHDRIRDLTPLPALWGWWPSTWGATSSRTSAPSRVSST